MLTYAPRPKELEKAYEPVPPVDPNATPAG